MKLPRDLSGSEVAKLLERHYGYCVIRTKGSRIVSSESGRRSWRRPYPRS